MDSDYVSPDNAKRMAKQGFPQEEFPHVEWYRHLSEDDASIEFEFSLRWKTYPAPTGKWYAAPTHLTALNWLAYKYHIRISIHLAEDIDHQDVYTAAIDSEYLAYDNADELISAILDYLAGVKQ